MLSYQHIYHAGNFADVQKHAILIQLLKTLQQKNPKMTVLDTHAGRGIYDLASEEALKTSEFTHGAQYFYDKGTLPSGLKEIVEKYNPDGILETYPGSAVIAREMMRSSDKLICTELHPGEFAELEKNMKDFPNTDVIKADGFQALVDMMPLADRKGLVIVDPSYEIKTEYDFLAKQLYQAWKRWPQGVFMIWYPILDSRGYQRMLTALRNSKIKDVMVSEIRLDVPPQEGYRMTGSGIIIINPPWPESALDALTQYIANRLPVKAFGDVFWLDNMQINPETGTI